MAMIFRVGPNGKRIPTRVPGTAAPSVSLVRVGTENRPMRVRLIGTIVDHVVRPGDRRVLLLRRM